MKLIEVNQSTDLVDKRYITSETKYILVFIHPSGERIGVGVEMDIVSANVLRNSINQPHPYATENL